jgi:hypothetical protein
MCVHVEMKVPSAGGACPFAIISLCFIADISNTALVLQIQETYFGDLEVFLSSLIVVVDVYRL